MTLESDNHILLGDEAAWPVSSVRSRHSCADRDRVADRPGAAALLPREREVLSLAATGQGNDEIAGGLHLSVRTVERHFHNIYAKLGVSGRSAHAAAVPSCSAAPDRARRAPPPYAPARTDRSGDAARMGGRTDVAHPGRS